MTWMTRYQLPDMNVWQGRTDSPENTCFFQVMQCLDLTRKNIPCADQQTFALLGFCCDEGIRRNQGRIGAKEGPAAIRHMLAKLPIQKSSIHCFDAGNITCTDDQLEEAQQALAEAVTVLLQRDITPIILGGGHELAFGHYQGIAKSFRENIGIVNFDAHFDMRPLLANQQGSSGTPFLQIAHLCEQNNRSFNYYCLGIQAAGNIWPLFELAESYQVKILSADELQQTNKDTLKKCSQFIEHIIQQDQRIYLSFCLDVLAAAYAPGVSAPQPLGLTPWQVIPYVRMLATSGKVVSYDIAELSPPYDTDQQTAKLAAQLIYDIVHHHKSD